MAPASVGRACCWAASAVAAAHAVDLASFDWTGLAAGNSAAADSRPGAFGWADGSSRFECLWGPFHPDCPGTEFSDGLKQFARNILRVVARS